MTHLMNRPSLGPEILWFPPHFLEGFRLNRNTGGVATHVLGVWLSCRHTIWLSGRFLVIYIIFSTLIDRLNRILDTRTIDGCLRCMTVQPLSKSEDGGKKHVWNKYILLLALRLAWYETAVVTKAVVPSCTLPCCLRLAPNTSHGASLFRSYLITDLENDQLSIKSIKNIRIYHRLPDLALCSDQLCT